MDGPRYLIKSSRSIQLNGLNYKGHCNSVSVPKSFFGTFLIFYIGYCNGWNCFIIRTQNKRIFKGRFFLCPHKGEESKQFLHIEILIYGLLASLLVHVGFIDILPLIFKIWLLTFRFLTIYRVRSKVLGGTFITKIQ